MSHTTFWPKKIFYYPIGNTPPVCLTDHLPPEVDAKILLLGCGDPRNILYTVNVDHGIPTRSIDITCCDWEPAIIARNVLLFTFIADDIAANRLTQYWTIFYDLFFDKQTASLLNDQCLKLVNCATDTAAWNSSSYGRFLRFTTQESLNEARRHWSSYAETLGLSDSEQNQLKQTFLSQMKEKTVEGSDISSIYAAAPMSAMFTSKAFKTYTRYWETGITNPDTNPHAMTQINPTFLFSMVGRRFNLHYGTDVCSSFHLALALTKSTFENTPTSIPAKTESDVWEACRTQFSRWSKAFHRSINTPDSQNKLIIRFVAGDALAFCEGLSLCRTGDFTPSVYSSAWGASKFSFYDESMPTSFNVIDSSNLSDHLGLMNIIIAAVPLLEKAPYTVLHSDSLLSYEDHPTKRSAIEKRALLDFSSLALLLGITPICHSSGLTFRNGCESASFAMMVKGRLHERISWRFSDFTHGKWNGTLTEQKHELHFTPTELADKLFAMYLNMFENENMNSLLNKLSVKDVGLATLQSPHYHRQSFARFLALARASHHIEVDWPQTLDRLIDRITESRCLLVGSNNFQNLFADLHMLGVPSETPLMPGFVVATYGPKPAPFQTWDLIPPVVCVVLKVPRSALKVLEEPPEDEVGNPILECETFHEFHNTHSSIRPIFGDIIDAPDSRGQKIIVEDQRGQKGTSPLIVSFYMPSWILAAEPHNVQVGLCIKTTPMDSFLFASKLGPHLRLFSAKVSDRDHVFILPERPDNPGELRRIAATNAIPPRVNGTSILGITGVTLNSESGSVSLSKRLNITAAAAKEALANNSPVKTKQTAPCCIEISIDEHQFSLFYPIPIDGTRSKTRIARKSSYVEIEVPSRSSPLTQLELQPFPMTLDVSNTTIRITCWNAPYISLNAYPFLPRTGDLKWISTHLGFSLSHSERRRQYAAPAESWEPTMNFKTSISNIFLQFTENQVGIFLLQDPTLERPRPHAILFLSSIRIDLSSATIIGDAAIIIPTSPSMMNMLSRHLYGSTSANINTYGEEVRLWKHALPAFVERCRQWQHLPTCEYHKSERVPLSTEYNDSPLCSCGKGKDLGPFLKNDRWKELAPHATRVAVSLVFPVTYLENVTEGSLETMLSGMPPGPGGLPKVPGVSGQQNRNNAAHQSRCSRCESTGKPKLLQCSICQVVKYCSKDCQKADWKTHKHICKALGKLST